MSLGSGGAAGVRFQDLGHGNDFVGPLPQFGGPSDGIARLQRVEIAKVVPDAPVMPGNRTVSIPQAGIFEVARALGKGLAVRPLVHLDGQADSRDFQCSQVPAAVIEVRGDGGKCGARPGPPPLSVSG